MANLLGLAIGFALSGAALLYFMPQLAALRGAAPSVRPVAARPDPGRLATPPAQPAPLLMPAKPAPSLMPAPMPRIAAPGLPILAGPGRPPRLPAIVHPDQPNQELGVAGTGFFIAEDGTVLTAAHVVADCRRTQVLSSLVHLTAATLLATDTKDDVALLHVGHIRPPAVLPLGRPAGPAGRLFVLGYPQSAGLTVPAETWGTLENAKLPSTAGPLANPRVLVWMQASAVTHGYSGGPILDPRNGEVVGLVKATVDDGALRQVPGMPTSGMAIGPGSGRLIAFVQQELPWLDVAPASAQGDDAIDLARRATVHVLCWH